MCALMPEANLTRSAFVVPCRAPDQNRCLSLAFAQGRILPTTHAHRAIPPTQRHWVLGLHNTVKSLRIVGHLARITELATNEADVIRRVWPLDWLSRRCGGTTQIGARTIVTTPRGPKPRPVRAIVRARAFEGLPTESPTRRTVEREGPKRMRTVAAERQCMKRSGLR